MRLKIISKSFNKTKGGIESWSFYILRYLEIRKIEFKSVAIDQLSLLGKICLLLSLDRKYSYILTDWFRIKNIPFLIIMNFFWIFDNTFFIFIHGDDILNLRGNLLSLFKMLSKIKNVKFICTSDDTRKLLISITNRNDVSVCHPFLDFNDYNDFKPIKLKKTGKIFFTITRLVTRKNVLNAVKAVEKYITCQDSNITYYIAGIGPEKETIQKYIIDNGLSENIIYLGFLSDHEKNFLLKACDLFLLPSIKIEGSIEGYGIVFIESNYFGKPVISGNTGGMNESVINNVTGLHTDGTVESIYNAIVNSFKINFDIEKIKRFALKHNISTNSDLINLLNNWD